MCIISLRRGLSDISIWECFHIKLLNFVRDNSYTCCQEAALPYPLRTLIRCQENISVYVFISSSIYNLPIYITFSLLNRISELNPAFELVDSVYSYFTFTQYITLLEIANRPCIILSWFKY